MKYIIHFFVSLILFAFYAIILSLIFGGIQWIISLLSLVNPPTWSKIISGAIMFFLAIVCYSLFKTLQTVYHMRKNQVFKDAVQHRIVNNWDDWKRIIRK